MRNFWATGLFAKQHRLFAGLMIHQVWVLAASAFPSGPIHQTMQGYHREDL